MLCLICSPLSSSHCCLPFPGEGVRHRAVQPLTWGHTAGEWQIHQEVTPAAWPQGQRAYFRAHI